MTTITNLNRKPDGVFETLEASESVTANGTSYIGTFATEGDLPDPANFDEGDEATVISDPNGQTSKYTLVDE